MENGKETSSVATGSCDVRHARVVVLQAHQELRQLLQRRAEVVTRIAKVRRTISDLANLCGDGVLSDELREVVEPNRNGGKRVFASACRMILMEAGDAMRASDICDSLRQKMPAMVACQKDPIKLVITVLNRLVRYGEARTVLSSNGTRAWFSVAEHPEPHPNLAPEIKCHPL